MVAGAGQDACAVIVQVPQHICYRTYNSNGQNNADNRQYDSERRFLTFHIQKFLLRVIKVTILIMTYIAVNPLK